MHKMGLGGGVGLEPDELQSLDFRLFLLLTERRTSAERQAPGQ